MSAQEPGGRAGAFRALHSRNYRLFFVGQVLSVTGTWVQSTAIGWIVLRQSDDAAGLGTIVALQFLPLLLLGAYAGTIADRHDRRRILLLTNTGAAVVALATAVLVSAGAHTVLVLGPMVLLLGVTAAFETPTRQSFIAQLVAPDDIPSAVGLNGAVMTGGRVMGASIAGVLIAALGASVCLYVNAVSYLAVIVALVMIRHHDLRPATVIPRARGQVRDGLRYAMRTPEVRFPLVAMAVVGTISLNQAVLVPLLARVTFDAGPELFAAFAAVGALGALTGSLTAARVTTSTVSNIGRAAVGFGVVYSLTAFAPWVWLALVGLAGAFFNASLYIAWTNARLQQESADAYRGRVMALYTIVFLGSTPVGSVIVGALAQATNPRVAILLGGVAALGTGLVALARARRHAHLAVDGLSVAESRPAARARPVDGPVRVGVRHLLNARQATRQCPPPPRPPGGPMNSRVDRHREMAEAALRAHQALTQAHVDGREPEPVQYPAPPRPVAMYIPQYGEREREGAPLMGGESSLRELQMYWKRIPDFGVKEYQIFTSERGWAQVLVWQGTGEDGNEYRGDEVDVVYTDDDFNVTRVEIYSDTKQWMALVAYANDTTEKAMAQSTSSYADLMGDS